LQVEDFLHWREEKMAYSNSSRADRLYGLAAYCQQKKVTPDDNKYAGIIIQICTAQFGMSREAAMKMAADLKSAYGHDKWASILSGASISSQVDEQSSSNVEEQPASPVEKHPTLEALNKLFQQKSEPVKLLQPHRTVKEPDIAPATIADNLIELAEKNNMNGVGRLTLAEVRYEFGDKAILVKDIVGLLAQHAPNITVETRPGNIVLLYFNGKEATRAQRDANRKVQPMPPAIPSDVTVDDNPKDTYDTADFKAYRPKDRIC
jgi:hypothetical protein